MHTPFNRKLLACQFDCRLTREKKKKKNTNKSTFFPLNKCSKNWITTRKIETKQRLRESRRSSVLNSWDSILCNTDMNCCSSFVCLFSSHFVLICETDRKKNIIAVASRATRLVASFYKVMITIHCNRFCYYACQWLNVPFNPKNLSTFLTVC